MSLLLHIIVIYIKENIITKLQITNYTDPSPPETKGQAINRPSYLWKNAICEKTSLHGWFNARAQDIHWEACKCHLIGSTNELADIQIGDFSIKNSVSEKLLGVNIDSKLKFDCHVNHLCNKANKKLRGLAKVTPYDSRRKENRHELIF